MRRYLRCRLRRRVSSRARCRGSALLPIGAAVAAGVLRAAAPLAAQPVTSVRAERAPLERVTERTAQALAAGWTRAEREVWPGAFADGLRVGLHPYDGAGMLLVGAAPAHGAPWSPVGCARACEAPGIRAVPRGFPYADFPGGIPLASLAPDAPYALAVAASVAVPYPESGIADTVRNTLTFVFHERFHVYQRTRATGGATQCGLPSDAPPPRGSPPADRNAQLAAERSALAVVLDLLARGAATDAARVRDAVRRYRTVRAVRVRTDAESCSDVRLERQEGVADYVGIAMAHAALGLPDDSTRAQIRRNLDRPPFPIAGGNWSDPVYRGWHVYAVGAAKTLVARTMRTDWREALQRGCTLDDLLTTDGGCGR